MSRWLNKQSPLATLVLGLCAGLLVAGGAVVGSIFSRQEMSLTLPPSALNATATHGADTFAIATGPIADGVEGIFFLDFLTGELSCWVLNPRSGKLGGHFKQNVVNDLSVERGKKPSYLMVTGQASFRSTGGGYRPAESVVYVLDANTGRFAAYSLPWNRQAAASGAAQLAPMVNIGKGSARNLEIRE
ncbi:MAG: hypothetical protein QGG36_32110 [Pirellulaceae bacterium]|nr:hypothetical protein [Pirellulaceae bacterium]MDP7020488.1 hypothetical protein [Pirellulaceae bacterium]